MSEANKTVIRRLIDEVINQDKLELLDELFTPLLAAQVKQAFAEFRASFSDWREGIVELVAEGDRVVGHFKCMGTHDGEFMGQAATGKWMEVHEVFFVQVIDGRISEFWGLEDTWSRMEQLGLMPTNASSPSASSQL
jgi:predicted ester cyclase